MSLRLEELCSIAVRYAHSDKSIRQLFESAVRTPVPRSEFIDALVEWFGRHPDDVNHWLNYSEDKRSSPTPYVLRPSARDERQLYEVGFYDPDLGYTDISRYPDGAHAVADFLHREVNWVLRRQRVT